MCGVALPIMRHLTHQTGLTCHLAILDGPTPSTLKRLSAEGFIRMDTWVGRRMRVHATSVGKALVAHIPQDRLEQILAKVAWKSARPKPLQPCHACSRNWKKSRPRLCRRRRREQSRRSLRRRPGFQSIKV
jgi:DNA-binding IclR family transcriptional regulator